MERIVKIENKKVSVLDLEYVLGNTCNYKCHYCFPGSNEGTYRWPDTSCVSTNVKHLFRKYKTMFNKHQYHLKLVGGEPTLWSDLIPFISNLRQEFDIKISISTNASRTLRYWEEASSHFDNIMISVHHEYANLDHIIKVADLIYKKNNSVLAVNVLMDPTNWEKCVEIIDYLLKNSNNWLLASMPVTFNGVTDYTDEQNEYLKIKNKRMPPIEWVEQLQRLGKLSTMDYNKVSATFKNGEVKIISGVYMSINNLNRFYGYSCNLGIDRIFIDPAGQLTGGCGQQIFNGSLNINDSDFKDALDLINPEPVICKQLICSCIPDSLISKCKLT